jgi:uncharacterized membrane protein
VKGDPLVNLKTIRAEALSDGVFAIAMTILVLSISVPMAETVSGDRLVDALRHIAPQVAGCRRPRVSALDVRAL